MLPCNVMDLQVSLAIIEEIKSAIEPHFIDSEFQGTMSPGRLKQVVAVCQDVIEQQLSADLDIADACFKNNASHNLTELRKSLLHVVPTHSPFWDKYEIRLQFIASMQSPAAIQNLELNLFGQWARRRYPSFYIVQDVLYYSEGGDRTRYELLLQSLQLYLNGQLLRLGEHPAIAASEFAKALKLICDGSCTPYCEHLKSLIQTYHPA